LVNLPHEEAAIKKALSQFDMKHYFKDITAEELLSIMF